MKWELLLSDTLARTVGVIGLVGVLPFAVEATLRYQGVDASDAYLPMAGFSLILLWMALVFLLPDHHERMMRRTLPVLLRIPFRGLTFLWVFVLFFGAAVLLDPFVSLASEDVLQIIVVAAFVVMGFAISLLMRPYGLAWRQAAAERSIVRSVMAAQPGLDRKQVVEYARSNAMTIRDAAETARRVGGPRRTDIFDLMLGLPIIIAFLGGLYALRIEATAQTTEFDAWLDSMWLIGTLVFTLVCCVPMLIKNALRGTPRNSRRRDGKSANLTTQIVVAPFVGFLAFILASYDGIPWAWNAFQDVPVGSISYEVADVSTSRRTRDCTMLNILGDRERRMFVCNVSGNLVQDLRVGDVIEVTGPLSEYGHTFEQVRIVQ